MVLTLVILTRGSCQRLVYFPGYCFFRATRANELNNVTLLFSMQPYFVTTASGCDIVTIGTITIAYSCLVLFKNVVRCSSFLYADGYL